VKVRKDSRPLYIQAEQALAELVRSLPPGERLPSEPALAQQLGVSRSTLREAMHSFEGRGLITRRQGVGTFVNVPHVVIESGLEVLESLDSLVTRHGLQCATRDLKIREELADQEAAARLEIPAGSPLTVVSRTKTANGRPVAYMIDILPAVLVTVEEMAQGFRGSVLDFLLARQEPAIAWARAIIISVEAGRELGRELEVRPGAPLLLLEETTYAVDGRPVDYSRNYFVPHFFDFHVVRRVAS
jgi:GntR family transcriptional regulator